MHAVSTQQPRAPTPVTVYDKDINKPPPEASRGRMEDVMLEEATAEEFLRDWRTTALRFSTAKIAQKCAGEKIVRWVGEGGALTRDQATQFALMFNEMPADDRTSLWHKLAARVTSDLSVERRKAILDNLIIIHPLIKHKLVAGLVGEKEAERMFANNAGCVSEEAGK